MTTWGDHCLPLLSELSRPPERGGNRLEQGFLLAGNTAPEAKHLGEAPGRLCHLMAGLHDALEALLSFLRREEGEPTLMTSMAVSKRSFDGRSWSHLRS